MVNKSDYTQCHLCEGGYRFSQAQEVAEVPCNVEAFHGEKHCVWRCPGCGSLHSLKPLDFELYYKGYPMQRQRLDYPTRLILKNRLKILEGFGLNPQLKVLDYGCGTGIFIQYLKEKGYQQVFGYDPFTDPYNDPKVLEDKYDFVMAQDVIEHDDEPLQMMERLIDRLKPSKGRLALGTPNANSLSLDSALDQTGHLHQPYHRHLFTEEVLRSQLEKRGLSILGVDDSFYGDTKFPFMNMSYITRTWRHTGSIDISFERPAQFVALCLRSPSLFYHAFLGFLHPDKKNMTVVAQN